MNRNSMQKRTRRVLLMAGISVSAFLPACVQDTTEVNTNAADKPRLILQITVDQFRGDLPTRYADRLGEGGLRYLLEEGIHYNNAHSRPCEHGDHRRPRDPGNRRTTPAAHGMIGNIWFDRTTGVTTYNIEDPDYRLLTEGCRMLTPIPRSTPLKKRRQATVAHPRPFLTTTFSDELASADRR